MLQGPGEMRICSPPEKRIHNPVNGGTDPPAALASPCWHDTRGANLNAGMSAPIDAQPGRQVRVDAPMDAQPGRQVRVEPLTEPQFGGAVAVQNSFLGARKRACCICPYSCCPASEAEFAAPYRAHPDQLATTGVAIRETDGAVVGFVQMSAPGHTRDCISRALHTLGPTEVYIEMLAVSPEARGQGVGTKMLQWAEATAVARGASSLGLGVVNGNPARRLYNRFGFVPVRQKGACSRASSAAVLFCLLVSRTAAAAEQKWKRSLQPVVRENKGACRPWAAFDTTAGSELSFAAAAANIKCPVHCQHLISI